MKRQRPATSTHPAHNPDQAATTSTTQRIEALDLVRGTAILGTLGTNIWIFTDPAGPAGWLRAMGNRDGSLAEVVESLLLFLVNGKSVALLSIMFGVGLELQYRSARRRGRTWPGRYLWRCVLLLLEGALHYLLIFEFDVLMGYALVAMYVSVLVGARTKVRYWWMATAALLHTGMITVLTLGMHTGHVALSPRGWTGTTLYSHGGWLEQVQARIADIGTYRSELVIVIPMSTVLFLAGIELMRAGAFTETPHGSAIRARLIRWGLGFGVPVNLVTTFAGQEWFFVDRYVLPPVVAFGLLGLIVELAHRTRGRPGPLRSGLVSTGRTAMSCYVFQNLLSSALCYGWGLGLATTLDPARPWWVIVAWCAVVGTFMVLASWWLRRFRRGPLESAMHLAYEPRGSGLS
ncbi:DUF418 domain-containing protein [Actinopolyspora halophila]|uniref:DUF418 domain-containing protein n=1 Tax=Actinopolyspora halophila TaxID=1850 RepID=UPI00036290B1|nr:DUF418 domain-containing protein [Actinopolyspora halophila]